MNDAVSVSFSVNGIFKEGFLCSCGDCKIEQNNYFVNDFEGNMYHSSGISQVTIYLSKPKMKKSHLPVWW